ncbi:PQQ-dependent sugar dehydrogenase [Chitinophaga tropicalis]|uniref:Sorbosone dehydrogenase n=1 Tax=Chitinophaga tropicalis TaxID=2683588 RepID=A0A7K1U115_9BACT|nr:PQQ-dependent sugar dehydrogenase [Chitinophaga tropicalis]MVT08043.1 sorbosone dehydrogenase [Chitinophaga tropicalis]
MSKLLLMATLAVANLTVASANTSGPDDPKPVKPDANNAGLKLPAGFGALVVADGLGRARHIAVTSKGDIYVKLDRAKDGKGIIFLEDSNGDGKSDKQTGFGNFGGTGIYVKGDYLYASSNTDVYRYKLDAAQKITDTQNPENIVTGLINRRQHESKSLVLDDAGNLYVNVGAYSNSCQEKDRTAGSMGMQPCPILDSAGGIWQFKADKAGQHYGDGVRYATGLRNVVGLDWNKQQNQLFVMQHGRDQLHDLFPALFTEKQSADLPAECLYAVKQGSDCGWPYIYYDPYLKKKMLAPEYGGDGKKTGGDNAEDPLVAFPAHMAPNGLLFYTGTQFPEKYRNGAFIAFHGSWNRSPENQAGYYVVFVPFKNGKPSGDWEVFADGFAGTAAVKYPGDAQHRPCGLAQGPDGSLYVSDDVKGTIYRIVYKK